jgi:hypothetical protein
MRDKILPYSACSRRYANAQGDGPRAYGQHQKEPPLHLCTPTSIQTVLLRILFICWWIDFNTDVYGLTVPNAFL